MSPFLSVDFHLGVSMDGCIERVDTNSDRSVKSTHASQKKVSRASSNIISMHTMEPAKSSYITGMGRKNQLIFGSYISSFLF